VRNSPLNGRRVRLVRCNDPHTKLQPGTLGTVTCVDDLGTVHVRWDSGSTLGLCEDDGDRFEVLP
jgi:Domain of unknown function (DUF4314)